MKKKIIYPLLLSMAGLLIGLIIAESLLYVFYFKEESQKFYVWRPHTKQVFRPLPDALPGIKDEGVFLVNAEGMRGDAYGRPYQTRILAIGGSTTECLYLDQSESWPQLLQQHLQQATGSPVFVGNVGKSGLNSREHIYQAKYLLEQYREFDIVLLLLGVNDMSLALSDPDYQVFDPEDARQRSKVLERAFSVIPSGLLHETDTDDAFFYQKTAIAHLLRRAKRRLKKKDELILDDAGTWINERRQLRLNAAAIIDTLPDLSAGLAEYKKNINQLIDIVQQRGVKLALLTQPYIWRDDLPPALQKLLWFGGQGEFTQGRPRKYYSASVMAEAMALYNQTLLQICRDRQLICIDLAAVLAKDTSVFFDDVHFNESGARQVAERVSKDLLDSVLH